VSQISRRENAARRFRSKAPPLRPTLTFVGGTTIRGPNAPDLDGQIGRHLVPSLEGEPV
jgi:hypothetical protein